MNKQKLVDAMLSASPLVRRKDAEKALDAVFQAMGLALARSDRVMVTGFGTFEKRMKKGQKVRQRQDGRLYQTSPRVTVRFRAHTNLRRTAGDNPQQPVLIDETGSAVAAAAGNGGNPATSQPSDGTAERPGSAD